MTTSQKLLSAADLAQLHQRFAASRRVNQVALALSLAAMAFGVFWLVWILWETCAWAWGAVALALHRDDAAAQRGRRPGQRHLRLGR
jgi:phosphate transport system permease protein